MTALNRPSRLKKLIRRWRQARVARRQAAALRMNAYLARDVGLDADIAMPSLDRYGPQQLPLTGTARPRRGGVTSDAYSTRCGTGAPWTDPRSARRLFP